jgi:hypothetical protein
MNFFGLYLYCTLVAVLLLIDGSTCWLLKVMEMLLTVRKSSKFSEIVGEIHFSLLA